MRKKCEWKKGVTFLSLGLFTGASSCFSVPNASHPASVTSTDRLQTAVFFPLLGSFSNRWLFRHTVLLQEDAEFSLPSASRSKANPGAPVFAGALLCHVNHWSGVAGQELLLLFLERAVKMSELGRKSALTWPEPKGQTFSKLL